MIYDNDEDENPKEEYNPIEDIIEKLNDCRIHYYRLYNKDYKVASIRLRHTIEYVIQTAKQVKRDALSYRKQIEAREKIEKEFKKTGYNPEYPDDKLNI
jgi:hypothetical protein